ncbi:MAG: hypothetical protein R2932_14785 [Caldilineaceae bacterium]
MVALIYGSQAVALTILLLIPTTAGVWSFVVLFGAVYGAMTLARPAILADQFGALLWAHQQHSICLSNRCHHRRALWRGPAHTGFGNSYQVALITLIGLSLLAAGLILVLGAAALNGHSAPQRM